MSYDDEPPEDLTDWLRAGIRRPDAVIWRRWRFTLDEATAWIKAGVAAGLTAAQWRTAGVTPATMPQWRDAGITATEAVHWHEMGFSLDQAKDHKAHGRSPDAAFQHQSPAPPMVTRATSVMRATAGIRPWGSDDVRKFVEAGVNGQLLHGYLRAQWLDAEAVKWAKAGIEAHDARLWTELGITAAEAARQNTDPVRVMREWWLAGIPFEEVGEWFGAGLTADEAAAQRANGVTVEQAAALRALRRNESSS